MSRPTVILLLFCLIFGAFFTALFYSDVSREAQFLWTDVRNLLLPLDRADVTVNGQTFHVRIAATGSSRQRGLMWRRSLSETEGMLFVFPEPGAHGIWMKNVFFPLDILWIADGRVVHSVANALPAGSVAEPPAYIPEQPVDYVLELPGGTMGRLAITNGTGVEILWETGAAPAAR